MLNPTETPRHPNAPADGPTAPPDATPADVLNELAGGRLVTTPPPAPSADEWGKVLTLLAMIEENTRVLVAVVDLLGQYAPALDMVRDRMERRGKWFSPRNDTGGNVR